MTSSGGRFAQILVVFWSLAALESAGGKSVTWYEPLPAKTVSSAGDDLTPAETRVFEGYPTSLSWNFSLTSVTLFSAGIKFNTKGLANSGPGGLAAKVLDPFKDRFNFTWISQRLTLVIFNVTAADDESNGVFQCELSTGEGFWRRAIRIKIIERAKIVDVTSDQDVCEDTKVTLSCNATGKPDPNITWTRVWENGTDSGVLQSKDGYFVMDNIGRGSNGTFRCTAFNGVGEPVNQTVKVIVRYSEIRVVSSSNTVLEGDAYTLSCNATGDPMPTVTWIKVGNNQRSDGNVLNFTNINRNDAGNYTCEANNSCGTKTKTEAINVSFKPDNVTLESNTTESNGCSDLWVNFTCNSSEASPPVHNYVLRRNGTEVSFNQKGIWIEKISQGETFVYKCEAYQEIDNVTSTNYISLSVKEPPTVKQVTNEPVQEGGNVVQECDKSAGTPPPTFFWKKVNTSEVWYGKLLNISDIRRNQSGEYRCFASNTCGNASSTMIVDVQFKPDNVTLAMNTTENNGCTDMWVNFTCHSSEANPPVHGYVLLKNEEEVTFSKKGTWVEKISRGDTFVYKCQAHQQVGNVTSANNVTATVNVPAAVRQIRSVTVQEGGNVIKECNVTAGTPSPTVFWKKVNTSEIWYGKLLNITDIRRNQSGEYRCFASNTCGNDSTTMFIDVQFKPDNVTLERNTTENNGCTDLWVNFTCNSSEANPPVYNYELIKNETDFIFSRKGTWIEKISRGETFVYRCQAYQQVDNVTSTKDITLTVNDQPAIEQVLNVTVQEEGDVTKECDVTAGTPPPNVFWKNINTSEVIYGKLLNITNIRRNQSGEYRCFANNTCGNESSTMFIDVQYPSKITYIMNNMTVNDNDKVTLDCQANGNPSPNISWIFVSNNSFVPRTFRITGKQDEGYYRCIANNDVGSSSTREVYITVLHYRPLNTTLMINTGDSSVILKKTFTIRCDAPANPPASYEILRDDGTIVGRNSTVKTSVTEGIENNTVDFTCKPSNVYGKGPTVTIPVEVLTPPSITNEFSCEKYVKKGETAVFSCIPAGHPTPNITWTGMGIVQDSDGYNLNIKLKKNGTHRYKCKAENGIENSIEVTVVVVVEDQVALLLRYRISFPKEEFIGKLNDEGSDNYKELAEKVQKVKEAFPKCFTIEIKVERFSPNYEGPGVVAFICLIFNATMGAEAATSYLINAAKEGKLGNVDADSITYLEAITERKRCMAIYNDDQLCKTVKSVWIAVFSVGGVAIVAVIALGAYHVHKRRKCRRKDNSVHSGNEEEQAFSNNHSTLSDGKPCDYAMSGPQPSVDLDNEQQLGAVPSYAVVDKSRKKDKKKKKEAAEQKPVDDQYAVVDKSKKKKKNEADNTYAEVDTSKKSKKKPKPIEVLYADLGEFHSMKKMPAVSTSPKALPPIKRPEAYAETQYADITQFMKGNPEDPGAELPKDITTPAVNNTATGSKEESSAGNTGDGAKATNETGF